MTNNKASEMGFYRGTIMVGQMDIDGGDNSFHYGTLLEANLKDAEGNSIPTSKAGALFLYGVRGVKPQGVIRNAMLKARAVEGLYDVIQDEEVILDLLEACGLSEVKELEVPPVVVASGAKMSREEASKRSREGRAARKAARKLAMQVGSETATEPAATEKEPVVI